MAGAVEASFPRKIIYQSRVPSRVAFFVWTAALGKILTIDQHWQHIVVLDWCCMCKGYGESVDHLLLHFPIAHEMWSMLFGLFGVSLVMPRSVLGLLVCWIDNFGRHPNIGVWRAVPHCLMWCLWRERNGRSFEDCERTIVELKLLFFRTLLDWMSVRGLSFLCVFTSAFGILLLASLICLYS
jgi:hypothetical protein